MSLHIIMIWVFRLLGCLLIYAAVFMYEDEEGRWQNRLERWRETIIRTRESALSRFTAFMSGVAGLASHVFDRLFGKKLFSVRGVAVSICYSIASFFLCLELLSAINPQKFGQMLFQNWGMIVFFVLLGSVPAIVDTGKETLWLGGLAVFGVVIYPLAKFADAVSQKFGYARTLGMLLFVAMVFSLSFGFDVLYIALTRWMLRKASRQMQLPKIIGIVFLNALLGVVIALGPLVIGLLGIVSAVKFNARKRLVLSVSV